MELLAPAGDFACLEAAIEAGADAVYLGLSLLNARRSARNFTPRELSRAVDLAERHGVRTHLTLNIDITRRETGAAARLLNLAREAGVSAVIARDLAVVALWRVMRDASARSGCHCPALHLSTQAAVTNAEGVALAGGLGAARVVLARELALSEIRLIKEKSAIEIEVFAQGALCYSVSGRCLMSSWGGGRSGNRGLCTSPCRVPWSVGGESIGAAMSMRDLVTVDRLRELAEAGVDALKIEGRLKKPEWVREAVGLYRQALGPRGRPEAPPPPENREEAVGKARRLAAYAGRDITSAYLDGCFHGLTGIAARKSGAASSAAIGELDPGRGVRPVPAAPPAKTTAPGYALSVEIGERGVQCRAAYMGVEETWRMPRTRITREKKAVSVAQLFRRLADEPFAGVSLARAESNDPDFLLPPRNLKAIVAAVAAFVGRDAPRRADEDSGALKAPLSEDMRRAVKAEGPHAENRRFLGERPNQVRLAARQLNASLLPMLRQTELAVQGASLRDVEQVGKFIDPGETLFAFPEIFFPGESAGMRRFAEYCRIHRIRVEANCWGSVWLCRKHKLRYVAGQGLMILNHLAAAQLRELGAEAATISVEADRRQIEDICQAAALPLSLVVYARPPLAYTRIPAEDLLADGGGGRSSDAEWRDRRGIGLHPERTGGVTVFRSVMPFSWAGIRNRRIRVANLVMDLSAESSPQRAWEDFTGKANQDFRFNYDRGLK